MMKKLFIGILFLGFVNLTYSQSFDTKETNMKLEGDQVSPVNITYLNKVSDYTIGRRVLSLQEEVANYNITTTSEFKGKTNVNHLSFLGNKGKIWATFNNRGKLISSYERYLNIVFPKPVRNSIYMKYPGWNILGNAYVVSYSHLEQGDVKKFYRVKIKKDYLIKRLKIDIQGKLL